MNTTEAIGSISGAAASRATKRADSRHALQAFLLLDAVGRLFIWSAAIALTTAAFTAFGLWPERGLVGADLGLAWHWGSRLTHWVVLFNAVYVAELVVLRLLIPTPKEGEYPTAVGLRPNRQLLWACFLAVLTKARYEAPFPGFLVHHIASLPPMRWVIGPILGPRTRSCNVTEPLVIDPHLVQIGRNVVIGYDAIIMGHWQGRDSVVFKRTTIEDDVVVGGRATVFAGVQIRSGSVIGSDAVVLPDTVVGPNEFWAGVPARKIRDLDPPGQAASCEGGRFDNERATV